MNRYYKLKRYSIIGSAIIFLFAFFLSQTSYALPPETVWDDFPPITENLIIESNERKQTEPDKINLQTNLISAFESCYVGTNGSYASDEFKTAFDIYRNDVLPSENGTWAIIKQLQASYYDGVGEIQDYWNTGPKSVSLLFAENGGEVITLDRGGYRYNNKTYPPNTPITYFTADTPVYALSISFVMKSGEPRFSCQANLGDYVYPDIKLLPGKSYYRTLSTYGILYNSLDVYDLQAPAQIFLVNAPESNLSGHDINKIPDSFQPKNIPYFQNHLKPNGEFTSYYLRNLYKHPWGWDYCLYNDKELTDEITCEQISRDYGMFIHQFDEYGTYYLKISPYFALQEPFEVESVTFEIIHDGTDKSWTNRQSDLCDDDMLCVSPGENCDSYPFFIEKHACKVRERLPLGPINKSILATTTLFSRMRVDENNVTCGGLAVQNPKYLGRVFPLTSVVTEGCQKAETVHEKFPFIAIVVNFASASFLAYIMVRAVNKTISRDDDEIGDGL